MSKTRDFDALQKRRMRAANLLRRGFTQAQVAAKLGVSRQSVSRWAATIEAEGADGAAQGRPRWTATRAR